MPICIFSINTTDIKPTPSVVKAIKDIGRISLDILSKRLNVPKEDTEIRIVAGEKTEMKILMTVGGVQYPGDDESIPDPVFEPTDDEIHEAGSLIAETMSNILGEHIPVSIETFTDSAFVLIDKEMTEGDNSDPLTLADLCGPVEEGKASLKLVLSPDLALEMNATSGGNKEKSQAKESLAIAEVLEKMGEISEIQLGNEIPGSAEVALFADSPLSVEVHVDLECDIDTNYLMGLVLEMNAELVKRKLDRKGASIWVTQENGKKSYTF